MTIDKRKSTFHYTSVAVCDLTFNIQPIVNLYVLQRKRQFSYVLKQKSFHLGLQGVYSGFTQNLLMPFLPVTITGALRSFNRSFMCTKCTHQLIVWTCVCGLRAQHRTLSALIELQRNYPALPPHWGFNCENQFPNFPGSICTPFTKDDPPKLATCEGNDVNSYLRRDFVGSFM